MAGEAPPERSPGGQGKDSEGKKCRIAKKNFALVKRKRSTFIILSKEERGRTESQGGRKGKLMGRGVRT